MLIHGAQKDILDHASLGARRACALGRETGDGLGRGRSRQLIAPGFTQLMPGRRCLIPPRCQRPGQIVDDIFVDDRDPQRVADRQGLARMFRAEAAGQSQLFAQPDDIDVSIHQMV